MKFFYLNKLMRSTNIGTFSCCVVPEFGVGYRASGWDGTFSDRSVRYTVQGWITATVVIVSCNCVLLFFFCL